MCFTKFQVNDKQGSKGALVVLSCFCYWATLNLVTDLIVAIITSWIKWGVSYIYDRNCGDTGEII